MNAARFPACPVTPELLLELAGESTFARGKEYFLAGRVRELAVEADGARAQVYGSSVYRVRVNYSVALNSDCTCPIADEVELCKHGVAVGLAWIAALDRPLEAASNAAEPMRKPDPFAVLSTHSSADLLVLVRKWSEDVPELAHRLDLYAATQKASESDPSVLRALITRTIHTPRFLAYHEVPSFAGSVDAVVDALADAAAGLSATTLVELIELALAATEEVLANADDSVGRLGESLRSLEDLHLRSCARGGIDVEALGERLFRWEIESDHEVFRDAVTKYAGVLGARGTAAYRRLAEERWARVPALRPGERDPEPYSSRLRVTEIMRRLADLQGDLDFQIAVCERDLSRADGFHLIARRCHEAGRDDLALEWIDRGAKAFPRDQQLDLAQLAAEIESLNGQHARALEHRWNAFEIRPNHRAYRELMSFAERADQTEQTRTKALARLKELAVAQAASPPKWPTQWHEGAMELVEALLHDADLDSAWKAAHEYDCPIDLWTRLVELRRREHPAEVVPVYERLVEAALDRKNDQAYAKAVHWIGRIREATLAMHRREQFERIQNAIKTRHKAKRNFLKLLDAAAWA